MTEIKLRQIKESEISGKDNKQYREAIWKIIKKELNNQVSTWLFGTCDFQKIQKDWEKRDVYPLNDKKKALKVANSWHLALIYLRRRINEFYQAKSENNQELIQETIEFLKNIQDGKGEVSADTLNYERWGSKGSGESLEREVNQILVMDSLQDQLTKITEIILTSEGAEFAKLKREVQKFKTAELEQLVKQTKKKLNSEAKEWLDMLLESQKELSKNPGNSFARQQLVKIKSILNNKLLLGKQTELQQLEKQLIILQQNQDQQTAQTLQPLGIPGSSKNN